jgi:hypothetical protein
MGQNKAKVLSGHINWGRIKKFLSEGRVIESFEIYEIMCFGGISTVPTPTANNQL